MNTVTSNENQNQLATSKKPKSLIWLEDSYKKEKYIKA